MPIEGIFQFKGFFAIVVLVISLLYLYSLFNLYIGRKPQTHKIILLSINFLALVVFMFYLFQTNYADLENGEIAVFIIQSVILLAVITFGIIGGFKFDETKVVDRSEQFAKKRIILKRTLSVIALSCFVILMGIYIYMYVVTN